MPKIETYLSYKLTDYEEAAYLLARYFIERNFDGNVVKHKTLNGAYSAVISRPGFMKNLLGSRTSVTVTFIPGSSVISEEKCGTAVQIESGEISDGVVKEIITFALILPAVRKLSDYVKILNLCKTKSLAICEKLKAEEAGLTPVQKTADNINAKEENINKGTGNNGGEGL